MLSHEPVSKLDTRFSDPNAVVTEWDETRRILETAELFWLTTVRADGRPHVTPLVAVWLDEAIYFCTGLTEQKAMNLHGNPHVILTTGCNHWDTGLDVVVEGDAVAVTDNNMLERLAVAWATKWDGRWSRNRDFHLESVGLVLAVMPTKILAFGKGNFSVTRYQFDVTEGTQPQQGV